MSRRRLIVAWLLLQAFLLPVIAARANDQTFTITIPALNLSSSIVMFPLANLTWSIDPWEARIGYLEGISEIGRRGNLVLAGHSRLPDGSAGIFGDLQRLTLNSLIIISDGSHERRYRVTETLTVASDDLSIIYPTTGDLLTLITCEVQSYNPVTRLYDQRLVVIARPERIELADDLASGGLIDQPHQFPMIWLD